MRIFTQALCNISHGDPGAAAFLTSCHCIFHSSVIPEFLSDEEASETLLQVQNNVYDATRPSDIVLMRWPLLFVESHTMQFSPLMLTLCAKECFASSVLEPLLKMTYFSRSLKTFKSIDVHHIMTEPVVRALSKVSSLTDLQLLSNKAVPPEILHLVMTELPPGLQSLTVRNLERVAVSTSIIPVTNEDWSITNNFFASDVPLKCANNLRMLDFTFCESEFMIQLVSQKELRNLRRVRLSTVRGEFDLQKLTSAAPLITELHLTSILLVNVDSLRNLPALSKLVLFHCMDFSLSFLANNGHGNRNLLELLMINCTVENSRSVTPDHYKLLSHARNLYVLRITRDPFIGCLSFLQDMIHLRKLELPTTRVTASVAFQKLLGNLPSLTELNLESCLCFGNCTFNRNRNDDDLTDGLRVVPACRIFGGSSSSFYSSSFSQCNYLQTVNLGATGLIDDDLIGIDVLKHSLRDLNLSKNDELTEKCLRHCASLSNLERFCFSPSPFSLSFLKNMTKLVDLDLSECRSLTDCHFSVFSEEPHSFPSLQKLNLKRCMGVGVGAMKHMSENNNVVHRLKELKLGDTDAAEMSLRQSYVFIARFKGLRILTGFVYPQPPPALKSLQKSLTNLDHELGKHPFIY